MNPNLRRDDLNMIPNNTIDLIALIQQDINLYNRMLGDFETHEPVVWNWLTTNRLDEIEAFGAAFPGIYTSIPTLPVYLNGLMLSMYMRGYICGESKWKSQQVETGPYTPKIDDFLR